jgi:alkylmercury lyase-like protein
VSARGGSYYGNCVWDSLGIISLLGGEGSVETACPDCSEALRLRVADGKLVESEGVVHFSVPARRWWDDIVFT